MLSQRFHPLCRALNGDDVLVLASTARKFMIFFAFQKKVFEVKSKALRTYLSLPGLGETHLDAPCEAS